MLARKFMTIELVQYVWRMLREPNTPLACYGVFDWKNEKEEREVSDDVTGREEKGID